MKQLMNYIELVRMIDVETVETDRTGRVTDVKLLSGRSKFCSLTDKELKITCKSKEKDGNTNYDIDLKAYAALSPDDVVCLNNRLVLAGVSDDERIYWIGSKDFPALVTLITDLNTCEIEVSCQSLTPIF